MTETEGNRQKGINFEEIAESFFDLFDEIDEEEKQLKQVEVKTITDMFEHEGYARASDGELAHLLNEGWEVLDITVNSVLEEVDDVEMVFHYRIVTLKREY